MFYEAIGDRWLPLYHDIKVDERHVSNLSAFSSIVYEKASSKDTKDNQ
jgi:hypothetical protein